MHDELLIESVRSHNVLYDFSHPKYWDSDHKNKIWDQIGKKLNTPGPTCRSRWHNIRDQYKKTLKKTIAKSGQGAKRIPYYKYHELMSFMNGFFHDREKKNNIADDDMEDYNMAQMNTDNEDALSTNSSRPESSMETFPHAVVCIEPSGNTSIQPSRPQMRHPLSPDPAETSRTTGTTQDKQELTRLSNTTAYLMEYVLKKNQRRGDNPIDKFLEGIAPTLKSLTPYYQNLAKSEIFATVQKYEMILLKESQDLSDEFEETSSPKSSTIDTKDGVEKITEKKL